MEKKTVYTKVTIENWRKKAEKWDKLHDELSKFYDSIDDGLGDWGDDEELINVGKIAGKAFDYYTPEV